VSDPVLRMRADLERDEIKRVKEQYGSKVAVLPWMVEEPVGSNRLVALLEAGLRS
jgi:hypothetical protein